jgi:hypothetical protein
MHLMDAKGEDEASCVFYLGNPEASQAEEGRAVHEWLMGHSPEMNIKRAKNRPNDYPDSSREGQAFCHRVQLCCREAE